MVTYKYNISLFKDLMASLYHIIDKIPIFDEYGIEVEYETLAQKLVSSGLLRIDTDDKRNFVRFSYPKKSINKAFSYKELYEPFLQDKTYNFFKSVLDLNQNNEATNQKIKQEINRLKRDLSKLQIPDDKLALKLARLFVQSAHPIVISWLLLEEVEVYIAYSNIIGDVMDINTWQIAGENSGMQSTNGISASVFVSCGGNPFGETNKEHPAFGDGWPAIARLQIIAAQELGHYADIIRDAYMRHIDRHSADIMGRRAKPAVIAARKQDIQNSFAFLNSLEPYGIKKLIKHEEALKFFRKNKVFNLTYLYHMLMIYYYKNNIFNNAYRLNMQFIRKFAHDDYCGLMLRALSEDMLFNLSPQADVYKRSDKDEEEAIACIEALARVPQQVIKWGHLPTKFFMGELYNIYYREVIPSLINHHQEITGITYRRNYQSINLPLKEKIINIINRILFFRNKKSLPSREV
jgi:hypothetical protein